VRLRQSFYEVLRDTRTRLNIPLLLVTHDLEECFELADSVCLMEAGRFLQTGSAEAVLTKPVSVEAARFLGAQLEPAGYSLRDVAEQCLHGIDRDPLAVQLAVLSLWLATGARPGLLARHLCCAYLLTDREAVAGRRSPGCLGLRTFAGVPSRSRRSGSAPLVGACPDRLRYGPREAVVRGR